MSTKQYYSTDRLTALLPLPDASANKYTRGTLKAIVGSEQYPGAACLAAHASQRMGAGYTEVFTHEHAVGLVQGFRPSLVVRSFSALKPSAFAATSCHKPCAYVVGCGFDPHDSNAEKIVYQVLKHANAPVLIDGGALSALSTPKGQRLLKRRFIKGYPTVITPHHGEAARLAHVFNLPTNNEETLANNLALAYGVIAAVKGPVTLISNGDTTITVAHSTPALAKAGTGDVLAGMIGALLAQGLEPMDATVLGATLHAHAGLVAAGRVSTICTTAEDVIDSIPEAIAQMAQCS